MLLVHQSSSLPNSSGMKLAQWGLNNSVLLCVHVPETWNTSPGPRPAPLRVHAYVYTSLPHSPMGQLCQTGGGGGGGGGLEYQHPVHVVLLITRQASPTTAPPWLGFVIPLSVFKGIINRGKKKKKFPCFGFNSSHSGGAYVGPVGVFYTEEEVEEEEGEKRSIPSRQRGHLQGDWITLKTTPLSVSPRPLQTLAGRTRGSDVAVNWWGLMSLPSFSLPPPFFFFWSG